MAWCDRGVQTLLAIAGAFAAFSLMSVAIGTDYWLYSRAYICNSTNVSTDENQMQTRKVKGDLTHSGLWRICCIEGINKGSCFWINHFPDDNSYDTDSSEYILRLVRASSLFPILSTVLLMLGCFCAGVGRIYSRRNSVLLSAGILFVAAGLSNIIGIIVFISSNAGDPGDKKDEDKKNHYNYGWSFYSGALSFIVAEAVGVLAVNIYIEKNKETHFQAKRGFIKTLQSSSPYSRIPSFHHRRRRSRSSSRSTDLSRDPSPAGVRISGGAGFGLGLPMGDMSIYTFNRDALKRGGSTAGPYSPERDFLQVHNCFQKDLKDGNNRRTTPV